MLDKKIQQLNRIKLTAYILSWVLHLASSVLAAVLVGALAQVLHAPSAFVQTLLGALIFLLTLGCCRRRDDKITSTALLLSLDHNYATTTPAPYVMLSDATAAKSWKTPLQQWQRKIVRFETQRLLHAAGRAAVLLLACVAVAWSGDLSRQQLLPAYRYFAVLAPPQATLTVLPARAQRFELQANLPPQVALSQHELALIEVIDTSLTQNPVMRLRTAGEVWQEVQLRPQPPEPGHYAVTLSVDRSSTLHINSITAGAALAHITVDAGRAPQVQLAPQQTINDPHADEVPLPLQISVTAAAPLANIKLLITTRGGTFEELVNTIVSARHKHTTAYSFVPEPYMESDFAELELVAAATDRNGTTGHSAPLLINAISAWGRYRRTLEKLKEVKTMLDEKLAQPHSGLAMTAINQTMRDAVDNANTSPFFDGRDRLTMTRMLAELAANKDLQRRRELASTLERLNEFLLEHEVLNDRERDRDFFTAARHLSWIIARGDRDVGKYVQRLDRFLVERRQRWQVRVTALPAARQPPSWETMAAQAPLRKGLARLPALAATAARDELTALVGAYRAWLEELEAAEDAHYEQLVQQAQQVLQAARDDLREMQQRQTRISTYLDKAAVRRRAELQQGWAATRMRQNTNISAAKPLVQQLQAISPLAAQRLQNAVQAMQGTVTSGETQEFVMAESHADLAGRLLRHTRTATRQRLPMRRPRRRKISGDRYHGQPVIGGYIELQRDYRVNKRYREDILEAIRHSNLLEKHRHLLDAYLRRVIR